MLVIQNTFKIKVQTLTNTLKLHASNMYDDLNEMSKNHATSYLTITLQVFFEPIGPSQSLPQNKLIP